MGHLTRREKEILAYLKKNPLLSQDELADKLQISRSAVAVHISNLMHKGYILGKGYIIDDRSGVLVIGKIWLDIIARLHSNEIDVTCGGFGYTLAIELLRYRASPTFFTILGQDGIGDYIYNHLLQKSVKVCHILRNNDLPTAKRLRVLDGETVLYQIEEMEIINSLEKRKFTVCNNLIQKGSVLLIDATLPPSMLEPLMTLVKRYNIMTSLIGFPLEWYEQRGFCSCSQLFLVCHDYELQGFTGGEPENCFSICQKIVGQGMAAIIVVFGEQGVVLATQKETIYLPASPLHGTGSILGITAGIASGLTMGHSFRHAVRRTLGSTAGGQHLETNI